MPVVSSQGARRARFLAAIALVAGFVGCSFPEHTFVEDSEFYGTGAAGGGGSGGLAGSGGTGATGGGTGATGGGGTGATGGGGTGATGGGGTGGSGNEDCTNGTDDDGDSKIDCEDQDCQSGYTCAPAVPTGWTGPVVMFEGASPAPDCLTSGGFPTLKQNANSGINAPAPTCPSCSCDPPTGATCSVNVEFWHDTTCSSSGCWGCQSPNFLTVDGNGACKNINLTWGTSGEKPASVWFHDPPTVKGTCAPKTTGTVSKTPAKFDQAVRLCGDAATTGKGCGAGMCLPKAASPFLGTTCVFKTGDNACPTGYSQKSLQYLDTVGELNDTRDCSACACDAVSGGSCSNPSLSLYEGSACPGTATTMTAADSCKTVNAGAGPTSSQFSAKFTATASGGTCPSSGGQPTGSVTGTKPITVCCL